MNLNNEPLQLNLPFETVGIHNGLARYDQTAYDKMSVRQNVPRRNVPRRNVLRRKVRPCEIENVFLMKFNNASKKSVCTAAQTTNEKAEIR